MGTVKRALPILVGIVIVVGGAYGLIKVFQGRDSADLAQDGGSGAAPGTVESSPGDPPTSGRSGGNLQREGKVAAPVRALATGDVALVYGTAEPPPALTRLRNDATGSIDPELAAAGQMAFLVRRKGVTGIQALAWKRRLKVEAPTDPRLREFVDAWLGKGDDTG